MSEPILEFFQYEHLPHDIKEISKPYGDLAIVISGQLPPGPEITAVLKKLLVARDAAVRSHLNKEMVEETI